MKNGQQSQVKNGQEPGSDVRQISSDEQITNSLSLSSECFANQIVGENDTGGRKNVLFSDTTRG